MSFRRRRMQSPVRSIKHVVDTNGAITGAAPSITDVINTVDDPARGVSNNVANGSRVNAIFIRVEVVSIIGAGGIDNIYLLVFKNPGNGLVPPQVDQVGTSDNRRWVFHQEMLMTGQPGGNPGSANIPRTLFKGVVMLPRSYRRNGIDDKVQVVLGHRLGEVTQKTNFCVQAIYKEFR